jgi:hypothetical protein
VAARTIDVIPIQSARHLNDCWLEGLKVYAHDDSVWRVDPESATRWQRLRWWLKHR